MSLTIIGADGTRGSEVVELASHFVTSCSYSRCAARTLNANTIGSQLFHEASLVNEWVSATRYMKDIKETVDCAKVFLRLFARRGTQSSAELLGNLDYVNYETLRQM